VPFFPLSKVYLEAIEPREIPCRARKWHSHFLVDAPDVSVHPEALTIRRANRIERFIERVTIDSESRRFILAGNGEGHRSRGKVEQVTIERKITDRQFIFT